MVFQCQFSLDCEKKLGLNHLNVAKDPTVGPLTHSFAKVSVDHLAHWNYDRGDQMSFRKFAQNVPQTDFLANLIHNFYCGKH
jgi:hypothetical protein